MCDLRRYVRTRGLTSKTGRSSDASASCQACNCAGLQLLKYGSHVRYLTIYRKQINLCVIEDIGIAHSYTRIAKHDTCEARESCKACVSCPACVHQIQGDHCESCLRVHDVESVYLKQGQGQKS